MNKLKIKKDNIILGAIVIVFFILYFITGQNPNVLFVMNILTCLAICIIAKFSLFSIKSILINYVLLAIAFQYNTGESYGLLQITSYPLEFAKLCVVSLVYNIILLIYIINSDIIKNEENMLRYNVKESITFSTICACMAIIFSIIAFPSLNFAFGESDRFNALLPGNAWNHMAVISLIFAMPNLKKSKIVKFSYVFCILWFLVHSERVDMIGLILALLILFLVNGEKEGKKIFSKKNIKYYVIALIVFVVLIYIGEYRSGRTDMDFNKLIKKTLVQNTAADVGYVYNASILYPKSNGFLYGKTYLLYIIELLPFVSASKFDAVAILQEEYNTAGGILLLSEPYINFGIIGVAIFAIIELSILNIILKKKRSYNFFLYMFLLATTFRVQWYGLMYIEKGIVYIIPAIYVLGKILDKYMKNKNIKFRWDEQNESRNINN